jgi:dnd system-associated protein 4
MRPINREQTHARLCNLLAKSSDNYAAKSIFPTIKDLLLFAASLSFSLKKVRPLSGIKEDISENIFSKDKDAMRIFYAITLAHEGSKEIFEPSNTDKACTIFEQYANAGLYEIQGWIDKHPEDSIGVDTLIMGIQKLTFNEVNLSAHPAAEEEPTF